MKSIKELSEYQRELVKWLRRKRPVIYTNCNHVSSSGTFRLISCYVIKQGELLCLDSLIGSLSYYKRDKKRNGLRVSGCGMDMGFAVVYDFSSTIFPKGFKYRKNEPHRNGDPSLVDKNGGYALKQRWM